MSDADSDLGRRMMEEGLLRREEFLGAMRPPESHPQPPPARIGRYEIVRLLGKGASGEVYLARDAAIGREVALKILTRGPGHRFEREARILGALRHPNIVAVFDAGVEADRPYIVMERIEGSSLQEALREGRLSRAERVAILRDVALACHSAHEKGIVHRDLKPANILLDPRGRPFVTDFGIAKPIDAEERMTLTGTTIGTPGYMSPEQAEGKADRVDGRSDVFSLGVILYEMLTGRLPFQGETFFHIARQVIHDDPPRPRRVDPSVPSDLEAIALKAMEKASERRYPGARALADDLTAWLEGRPVTARPPSLARRIARRIRRRPVAGALLSAGAALAVILVIMQLRFARERERTASIEAKERKIRAVQQRVDEELRRIIDWEKELYKPPRLIGYQKLADSIAVLEEIVRTSGVPPQGLSSAYYGIARARLRMGRADLAMGELDLAVAHAPPKDAALYLFERARVGWDALLRETIAKNTPRVEKLAAEVRDDLRGALGRGLEDPWNRDFAQAVLLLLEQRNRAALEETIEACRRLREAKEKPAEEACKLLGDLRLMTASPDRAIEAYTEALQIRQSYVQAKLGLAMAHLARLTEKSDGAPRRGAEEILRHAWEAVEMNPAYGETYHLFALVCRLALQERPERWPAGGEQILGLFRQAIEVLERGRSARPDFAPLESALGTIHVFQARALLAAKQSPEGSLDKASKAFENLIRLDSRSPEGPVGIGLAHHLRAAWLLVSGKDADGSLRLAQESLSCAIQIDPRSAEAHRWAGYVHFQRGKSPEAIASWRKAIECGRQYRDELEPMIAKARTP